MAIKPRLVGHIVLLQSVFVGPRGDSRCEPERRVQIASWILVVRATSIRCFRNQDTH